MQSQEFHCQTLAEKLEINPKGQQANRIMPSLNPTNLLQNLKDKRELFGRVVQCRMGHSYTGEYQQSFLPLSPESNTCPCNNSTIESRNHILRDCPRYEQHQEILKSASKYIALLVVLGTKKSIEALTKFLMKSSAFSRIRVPLTAPQSPTLENKSQPDINAELNPVWVYDNGS